MSAEPRPTIPANSMRVGDRVQIHGTGRGVITVKGAEVGYRTIPGITVRGLWIAGTQRYPATAPWKPSKHRYSR